LLFGGANSGTLAALAIGYDIRHISHDGVVAMFSGLSAFPLTPMNEDGIDTVAYAGLVRRLADAGVDSIGALGSSGSYAYLSREERAKVARIAVENAGTVPVMIGIGALRTRDVLLLAEDAQKAGASAVLLAPVSYNKLSAEEVYSHFEAVTRNLSIPLCVYDNPGTTNFQFSDELHGRIAHLPNVRSIKIPGMPLDPQEAKARVDRLRALIPAHVSIGVSGDWLGAIGLNAGCEVWYSAWGGLFRARCWRSCARRNVATRRKPVICWSACVHCGIWWRGRAAACA
jgi:4-hydroxy-tetrahydrodipicolinate synthase